MPTVPRHRPAVSITLDATVLVQVDEFAQASKQSRSDVLEAAAKDFLQQAKKEASPV